MKVSKKYSKGIAWNGLTAITESPSGAEPIPIYADDEKYISLISEEEFNATIDAFSYPDEFRKCLGQHSIVPGITISQQKKSSFGLCYRTKVGNDKEKSNYGYKIHIIYDCTAFEEEEEFNTINDNPEVVTFSWEIISNPSSIDGHKPTAYLTLDFEKFKSNGLMHVFRGIEKVLYGTEDTIAKLPLITEIMELYDSYLSLKDSNGDYILDSLGNRIDTVNYE